MLAGDPQPAILWFYLFLNGFITFCKCFFFVSELPRMRNRMDLEDLECFGFGLDINEESRIKSGSNPPYKLANKR